MSSASIQSKPCSSCKQDLSLADFYRQVRGLGGRYSICKACCRARAAAYRDERRDLLREKWRTDRAQRYAADPEGANAYARAYRAANRDKVKQWNRRGHLRFKYGLSSADFDALLASQEGACALCLRSTRKLVIDHDHNTGRVRGLLCNPCNRLMDMAITNPGFVSRLTAYITP